MNILVLSEWGGGLPLSMRFMREGHRVKMWIKDSHYSSVGDGLVPKVEDYKKHVPWADFILADYYGFGRLCEELRIDGYTVWGGTEATDKWETDRGTGQLLCKKAGLTTLPSLEFNKADDAIAFVREQPGQYVVKPDGEVQDKKALTYVGETDSGEDVIAVLEHYKVWGSKIRSFELQKKVLGVEVAVSGFFNGMDFVNPIEVSFEHKKLMAGDIGPNTGEMGTTMYWTDKKSNLYHRTIEKLVPYLRGEGYVGYFDINSIANEHDIYPLEPTCRFGYPTIALKMETLTDNLGEAFYELACGVNRDLHVSNKVSVAVCVVTPPFPFEFKELWEKYAKDALVQIPADQAGIAIVGLRKDQNTYLQTLSDGSVVVCTGQGRSIDEAQKQAYRRADQIRVPNKMYRNDIGRTWHSDISQLASWGYL